MSEKVLAIIQENACIGCTKCIDVCPVDAILGSAKQMHTIIAEECIGCKLCVPACPVDCIDLVPMPISHVRIPPEYIKERYQARKMRLQHTHDIKMVSLESSILIKKQYIESAIARVKAKKNVSM